MRAWRVMVSSALQIEITDDGKGLPAEAARAGARGLKNMQFRAGQIGAQLRVEQREAPEVGTRVFLGLAVAASVESLRNP